MKTIAALIAVLLLTAPARAIELSLEENRAERGSVGYVDMQRLFSTSPDAQRAKEGFQELVRQAEERVNLRKAELIRLRQQLDAARAEREALALSSAAAPSPAAPPASSTQAAVAAPAPAAVPAPAPAAAPAAPPKKSAALALPGMSAPDAAPAAPPSASSAAAPGLDALLAGGVAKSTAAPAAVAVSTAASAAGMFPAPPPAPAPAAAPEGPTLGQRLLELDGKIIRLQSDIARAEGDLAREHDEADHGLLDVESRKTDQVLARLYRAITEIAHREGVSVVVDKTTILYGHPAVDLTDKVLQHLREAAQP